MHDASTQALLASLAAGDERAFAALYDAWSGRLFRAALSLLGRPADAEDAVHELFVALARSRASLAEVADLPGYLFASLRRAALHRGAAQNPAEKLDELVAAHPDHTPPPDHALESNDELHHLRRAIAQLPAEQRVVIELKVDAGLTFAEIAATLGVSPNTAASRYRYALNNLRALLTREPSRQS